MKSVGIFVRLTMAVAVVAWTGCSGNDDTLDNIWAEESNEIHDVTIGSTVVTVDSSYFNEDGSCKEVQLFPLQNEDDSGSSHVYDDIYEDPETDDLYILTLSDLYKFSPENDVPEKVIDFSGIFPLVNTTFWRIDDMLVFPNAEFDDINSVIMVLPIDSGALEPRINLKNRDEIVAVSSVQVFGHDVYWIQQQLVETEGRVRPVSVYTVMKSSIDVVNYDNDKIQTIYTAPPDTKLDNGHYAGGSYYVEQIDNTNTESDINYLQITMDSGEVFDRDTWTTKGGYLFDGDEKSLLWLEPTASDENTLQDVYDVFRVSSDGTEKVLLEQNVYDDGILLTPLLAYQFSSKDDLWVWSDYGIRPSNNFYLYAHRPGEDPQFIGCVNNSDFRVEGDISTVVSSIAIGRDAVYVGIFRDDEFDDFVHPKSTILKYPLPE